MEVQISSACYDFLVPLDHGASTTSLDKNLKILCGTPWEEPNLLRPKVAEKWHLAGSAPILTVHEEQLEESWKISWLDHISWLTQEFQEFPRPRGLAASQIVWFLRAVASAIMKFRNSSLLSFPSPSSSARLTHCWAKTLVTSRSPSFRDIATMISSTSSLAWKKKHEMWFSCDFHVIFMWFSCDFLRF